MPSCTIRTRHDHSIVFSTERFGVKSDTLDKEKGKERGREKGKKRTGKAKGRGDTNIHFTIACELTSHPIVGSMALLVDKDHENGCDMVWYYTTPLNEILARGGERR